MESCDYCGELFPSHELVERIDGVFCEDCIIMTEDVTDEEVDEMLEAGE
jgi:formylmethanofuran dehydrogenase subunit E